MSGHSVTANASAMTETVIAALVDAIGSGSVLTDPADRARYESDWRNRYSGTASCVVLPRSTAEVAKVMSICYEARVAVVPQGGRTGLVGGAIPQIPSVVISLERMTQIRAFDPLGMTLAVDAGLTLGAARAYAGEHDLALPILIGAEGSAQIGGIIATNAGGSNVLRYGMTRQRVIGLEVVLADGRIWNGMRSVAKDNTGYGLQHLFIGSEGTLGIVTGAVLQLSPAPRGVVTALCPVPSIDAALSVLLKLRAAMPEALVAFEFMSAATVALIASQRPDLAAALAISGESGACLLVECEDFTGTDATQDRMHDALGNALETGEISDALLAQSVAQRDAIWAFREAISFAQNGVGYSVKNDVSVPIGRIPDLLAQGSAAIMAICPDAVPICYGHLGDGNIHFNVSPAVPEASAALQGCEPQINAALADLSEELGGSFSAEHGVGQSKRDSLSRLRSGPELEMMRQIKAALDPLGLMNTGKLL
ncbi:FAD-binding oxidoreductase [Paracoccus aestuariivivens]|uniref:FAD-binding protein n=1 Tax=Paracoccus aestuariivivens TaxID=1820333 RepID=A0A6L6J7N7_9RHOB|nr:FAD-binding oxidoreductase [Paracoccus aestuariivivens]MTH77960.1 FAD-binding protein [Paracoccus aestuariivivens]